METTRMGIQHTEIEGQIRHSNVEVRDKTAYSQTEGRRERMTDRQTEGQTVIPISNQFLMRAPIKVLLYSHFIVQGKTFSM